MVLWQWLMRTSDIVTNFLDLIAFILATPEIIGRERIDSARMRITDAEENLISSWSVRIFTFLVTASALGGAGFWIMRKIFMLSVVAGVLAILTIAPAVLFIASVIFILLFRTDRESTAHKIIDGILAALVYWVFWFTRLMTPRGLLNVALVIFLISRTLSVAHSIYDHK